MALDQADVLASQEDTLHGRYLTFLLGEEGFGLEIRHVTEIIGVQTVTRLPKVPPYIIGIINLRGKVVPVIDMRLRFDKPAIPYDDRTCVIVVEFQDLVVGLIVDTVSEVITIDDEEVMPPPEGKPGFTNQFIAGIGRKGDAILLLLDCEKLLQEDAVDKQET